MLCLFVIQAVHQRYFPDQLVNAAKWRVESFENDQFETYKAISKLVTAFGLTVPPIINVRYAKLDREMDQKTIESRNIMKEVMKTSATVLRSVREQVASTLMAILPTSFHSIDDGNRFDPRPLGLLAHAFITEDHYREENVSTKERLGDVLVTAINSLDFHQRIALHYRLDEFFTLEDTTT